jgi:hypothetical protein
MPSLSERLKLAAAQASQPLVTHPEPPSSSPSTTASVPTSSPSSSKPSLNSSTSPTSTDNTHPFHLPSIDSLSTSFSGLRRSISLTRPSAQKSTSIASPLASQPPSNGSGDKPSTTPHPPTVLATSQSTPSLPSLLASSPPLPPPNPDDPSTYPLPPSPFEIRLPLPTPSEDKVLLYGDDVDEATHQATEQASGPFPQSLRSVVYSLPSLPDLSWSE